MNKKNWIVICVCCCALFLFSYKKINKWYTKLVTEWQIASMVADRSEEMRHFYVSDGYQSPDAYIAHGGGIGEFTYTNSLEAVCDSLNKGFRFIEIDMIETSDGHILGGHDWKYFKSLVNIYIQDTSDRPLSIDEVSTLKINGKYKILTGSSIYTLMKDHPQFILVTDKIRNYTLLLKEIPFPERIIVEVFSPSDYRRALQEGIKYPAYCIWNTDNLKTAVKYKFPIVTMDAKNFFENEDTINMVQDLHDSGVTILLFYTSFSKRDTPEFVKKYVGKTVSKIYTDVWSPTSLPGSVQDDF